MMEPPSSCHNLLSPRVTKKRKLSTRNASLSVEFQISKKRPRTTTTTTITSSKTVGKRVQFLNKDDIVELIRPSSEMTMEERNAVWYHKADFRANLQSARLIGQATAYCTESELYVDTLSNTYAFCCVANATASNNNGNSSTTDDSDVIDQVAEQLAVVAAATGDEGCHRGLERMTVPLIGLEIVRRRKLAIASVVLAQKSLNGYLPRNNRAEQTELLRMLSENETSPARKFAKAMGVVDAMGALVEYQQLQDI